MNAISKENFCIKITGDIEIWIDEDIKNKINNILLSQNPPKFLSIQDKPISTTSIIGIFPAQEIEEAKRRKNGEWKCNHNEWHYKYERCKKCDWEISYKQAGF